MLSLFIEGFMLGLGAAVPLGPINLLIMNEALKDYKKAVAIGFGAMSADITYLILILYGVTNYLKQDIALQALSLFGGLFLIYLALLTFKNRNQKTHKIKVQKGGTLVSKYIKGYLLTLLNPYTILFWLSVTSYSTTTQSLTISILGLVSSIILWVTIMPYLIHSKKDMISNKVSSIIATISSIILLMFGFSLLLNSFTTLDFSNF